MLRWYYYYFVVGHTTSMRLYKRELFRIFDYFTVDVCVCMCVFWVLPLSKRIPDEVAWFFLYFFAASLSGNKTNALRVCMQLGPKNHIKYALVDDAVRRL